MIMKKNRPKGNGFISALLINLVFDLEWTIPAWMLLAGRLIFGISIWWFVGALAVWVLGVAIKTSVLSWLVRIGNTPDPPKENKNPYSSKGYKPNK